MGGRFSIAGGPAWELRGKQELCVQVEEILLVGRRWEPIPYKRPS